MISETYGIHVTEIDELKLVGIRVVCPGDRYAAEIPKATLALKERLEEIKHLVQPVRMIGAFVVQELTPEEDGYWVCVEVCKLEDVPAGLTELTVPPQKYAVIKHIGPNTRISHTYEILHEWIAQNGHTRMQSAWHLEISDVLGYREEEDIEIRLYDTIK